MNQGLCLLDQALDLARQEMIALDDGAYDRAVELAEQRSELVSMAWNFLEMDTTLSYREKLVELTRFQEQLTFKATEAHNAIRESLHKSRLERNRMNGYHQSISYALQ